MEMTTEEAFVKVLQRQTWPLNKSINPLRASGWPRHFFFARQRKPSLI